MELVNRLREQFTRKNVLLGLGLISAGVYLKDCIYVYRVLQDHQDLIESIESTEEEKKALYKCYDGKEDGEYSPENTVDFKTYNKEMARLEELVSKNDNGLRGLAPLDLDKAYYITRESIAFVGGGRAAFLQIAHPYITNGVAQHSNLKFGVSQRFYRTFEHLFGIAFGDWESVVRSSKAVRGLHTKVRGKLGEDVGHFPKGHEFSANNLHAMYWVQSTLIETAVLTYELFVRKLSIEEKDEALRNSKRAAATFGIPADRIPNDWNSFMREVATFVKSDICTVGENAKVMVSFLLEPPQPKYAGVMKSIEWYTAVMLPSKPQREFYPRKITFFDKILWSLQSGYYRFMYRLMPYSFRWLTAYLKLEERLGKQRPLHERILMRMSAGIANKAIEIAMPPRDPTWNFKYSFKDKEPTSEPVPL